MKHGTHPPHFIHSTTKTTHPNKKHPYAKTTKNLLKKMYMILGKKRREHFLIFHHHDIHFMSI